MSRQQGDCLGWAQLQAGKKGDQVTKEGRQERGEPSACSAPKEPWAWPACLRAGEPSHPPKMVKTQAGFGMVFRLYVCDRLLKQDSTILRMSSKMSSKKRPGPENEPRLEKTRPWASVPKK